MFYKVEVEKKLAIGFVIEADNEEDALYAAKEAIYFDEYEDSIEDCGWEYDVEKILDNAHPSAEEILREGDNYIKARKES
jgi:hypothetical protein